MLGRRQMLGSTGLAGLFGAVTSTDVEAAAQGSDRALDEVKTAIDDLRKAYVHSRSFQEIAGIREQQRTFLRASGKFPDFIEVGMDVWFGIYDWHVIWQVPPNVTRDAAGRYTLQLVATTVILRPDMLGTFVGNAYDLK